MGLAEERAKGDRLVVLKAWLRGAGCCEVCGTALAVAQVEYENRGSFDLKAALARSACGKACAGKASAAKASMPPLGTPYPSRPRPKMGDEPEPTSGVASSIEDGKQEQPEVKPPSAPPAPHWTDAYDREPGGDDE